MLTQERHTLTFMNYLTGREMRHFFAKRPWLRPHDYERIGQAELDDIRRRDLSAFICGYWSGRTDGSPRGVPGDLDAEPMERKKS